MKTMFTILIAQGILSAASVHAAIVCEGKTYFGNTLKVTLSKDGSAHVEVIGQNGNRELVKDFADTANVWDGHGTGLVTSPGLSVKYNDWYGCIRNVVVTTNVRGGGVGYIEAVNIPVCSGGSTPDNLCLQRGSP